MKLLLEKWRTFLNEQELPLMGAVVRYEKDFTIALALINLNFIKEQLENSESVQDLAQKLNNKELYDKAVVGYIEATHAPLLSKVAMAKANSGGNCAGTYTVGKAIGKGYGELLYNALLGFAAKNSIFITADRHSVSKGARSRWSKIDSQTDEETPGNDNVYLGSFDNHKDKKTPPADDDCVVHGINSLDKGYQDSKQVIYYNQLESNLENFFKTEIRDMITNPGFFGKLFGQTPERKARQLQKQLLKLGRDKFRAWELEALKDRTLR